MSHRHPIPFTRSGGVLCCAVRYTYSAPGIRRISEDSESSHNRTQISGVANRQICPVLSIVRFGEAGSMSRVGPGRIQAGRLMKISRSMLVDELRPDHDELLISGDGVTAPL